MPYGDGHERIALDDTAASAVVKLADANPGALSVCSQIVTHGGQIDPDGFMGGVGSLLALDTHAIYGHKIWMLYKDVCGQDLVKMLAVLRACQLGFLTEAAMLHGIDNCGEGLDCDDLLAQVQKELPNFGQVPVTA